MPEADDPTRRAFVLGTAAAAALSGVGAPATAQDRATAALTGLGARAAVTHMVSGDFSVEHYAQQLLAACAANADLNAFISFEPQLVLEHARARDLQRRAGSRLGPLFGLPIPVKDSVNTKDYATSAGTPALRHFRPTQDAPTVALLKAAGALLLGKTNLHELSYGWTSNNHAYGAVHNPYDRRRIPGGSSGGTAAAVAARLAPLGVAEDTEGSIRIPAAFCGIAGFRPTTGRYSTKGCVPISRVFDQIGAVARAVDDLALFDSVVTGQNAPLAARSLRGVRLGIVRDYFFSALDPEVERLAELAILRLRDAGAVIVEGTLPDLAQLLDSTTLPVQNHDVGIELARYLQEYATGVSLEQLVAMASADIRELFRSDVLPGGANVITNAAYAVAMHKDLPALRRLYRDYFSASGVAAVLFPTAPMPPPLIGEEGLLRIGGRDIAFDAAVSRNIAPGSTAGLPGLVLPIGLTHGGLPVSLEFDAPSGSDRDLLALGASLEIAFGALPAPPADTTLARTGMGYHMGPP